MALNREEVSRVVEKDKRDRWDIYNNLPHGALTEIANESNCSDVHVKRVLLGDRKDHHGIIKRAELLAAINIWKTRFCRTESQL